MTKIQRIEDDLEGWELVGVCPVDAASLMIIDPCYIDRLASELGANWYEEWFINRISGHGPLGDPNKGLPFGTIVGTGYGDGIYPVWVRYTARGEVAEMRVRFIGTDDGGDFNASLMGRAGEVVEMLAADFNKRQVP